MLAGPPFIHRRMHERLRWAFAAASAAKAGNHDADAPRTPAALRRTKSRRETGNCDILIPSVIKHELARIQQRPEHVGQRLALVVVNAAALNVTAEVLRLVR